MTLLIVTQYYWPESFIITDLAEALVNKGHRVQILTGLPNYPKGEFFKGYGFFKGPFKEIHKGVEIYRVPLLARAQGFLRLALNYISFVVAGSFFVKTEEFNEVDVIFCYAPSPVTACIPALFLKKKLKKKLFFWVQDLWPESVSAVGATRSSVLIQLIGSLVRWIYINCDYLLIPSKGFESSLLHWGAAQEKIKYVPNWAPPFNFNRATPDWVTLLPQGFRIVFAGNLGKAQDLNTLVEAAQILRDVLEIKWIVVGDGSEKNWLEEQIKIKNLEQSIFLVGRKPYEEMGALFKAADVLYVSLRDEEIFSLTIPSKVQAYLSAAKPILASLRGEGQRLLTEIEAGLTCPPERPRDLADRVLVLKNKTVFERDQMGQKALHFFNENFEQQKVIDLIESLLNSKNELI